MAELNLNAIKQLIVEKPDKFTREDLKTIRLNIPSLTQFYASHASMLQGRMTIELIDSIWHLDDTSTNLINTTNRLTTRILWLTVVGVLVAAAGVLVAAATYLKS